jgi:hypothetical protein
LSGVQCHHVIGGDFNSVFDPVLDRKSCSQISRADDTSRDLYDLISALEIEDIWRRRNPNKKEYTFTRNESKSRIDFFLTSKEIDNEICNTNISNFLYSDHNLISIKVSISDVERGRGLWKLNVSILQETSYIELIENYWRSWRLRKCEFTSKREWWDMSKHAIKMLSIDFCSNFNRKKSEIIKLEDKLNSLKQSSEDKETSDEITFLTNEISNYYEKQANAAKIRSKAKHIEENEKPTAYFF